MLFSEPSKYLLCMDANSCVESTEYQTNNHAILKSYKCVIKCSLVLSVLQKVKLYKAHPLYYVDVFLAAFCSWGENVRARTHAHFRLYKSINRELQINRIPLHSVILIEYNNQCVYITNINKNGSQFSLNIDLNHLSSTFKYEFEGFLLF